MAIVYFISEDYERRTGGFIYNEHLVDWLERHADLTRKTVPVCFPQPSADVKETLSQLLSSIGKDSVFLCDHIYGCMFADLFAERRFQLALIFHHSLAEEHRDGSQHRATEASALQEADLIIATSTESEAYLRRNYEIAADRLVVALPGNDKPPLSRGPQTLGRPWHFLSIGGVIPRKRYEFALEALAALSSRDWIFTIVGSIARYPAYVDALREQAEAAGLASRIHLTGEVSAEELEQHWGEAHIYLSSSSYEGYGMSISEAMCHGVPVISTPAGAVAGWAGDGAIVLPQDDPRLMTQAIEKLIGEPAQYAKARDAGLALARQLPSWDDMMAKAGHALLHLSCAD